MNNHEIEQLARHPLMSDLVRVLERRDRQAEQIEQQNNVIRMNQEKLRLMCVDQDEINRTIGRMIKTIREDTEERLS